MHPKGSVSRWIGDLRAGDDDAARELWDRYFAPLVHVCRAMLAEHPRRVADEEDIALSAFDSFCRRAKENGFRHLHDRSDIWQLLVMIAARKAADQIQHECRRKRGGGLVRGESVFASESSDGGWGIEGINGHEATPEFVAIMADECHRLLESLGDEVLREIALLKLEGSTNQEIAERLRCSLRTVERKLWVIRTKWSDESGGHA